MEIPEQGTTHDVSSTLAELERVIVESDSDDELKPCMILVWSMALGSNG